MQLHVSPGPFPSVEVLPLRPRAPGPCPGGGIGRRCGLKIRCPKGRAGSSPAPGTNKSNNLLGFSHGLLSYAQFSGHTQGTYTKQQESFKHSVSDLIDRYMADHDFQQKRDKRNQERQLKFWKDWIGEKRLSDVSRALIIQVRDDLANQKVKGGKKRAAATGNRFLASISHAFSKAVEWEWADANPVKGVSRLTEPKGRALLVR